MATPSFNPAAISAFDKNLTPRASRYLRVVAASTDRHLLIASDATQTVKSRMPRIQCQLSNAGVGFYAGHNHCVGFQSLRKSATSCDVNAANPVL